MILIHMHMTVKVSSSCQQEDISAHNQVQFLSNYYTKVSLHGSDYKNVVMWLPEKHLIAQNSSLLIHRSVMVLACSWPTLEKAGHNHVMH